MKKKDWIDVVIGVLGIISIVIIIIESVATLSQGWLFGLYAIDLAICLVFAVEFVYRVRSTEDRGRFLKTHGFEVLAMVPAVALYAVGSIPAISAGLRSLRLIRVIRVIFVIARMSRFFRVSGVFVRRSRLIYLLLITIGVIFVGGFAAVILEHGTPDPQITNFADAVWWSISTVTTVGYGDIVPNSVAGRIMGMVLMVIGIGIMTAFISVVSATIVESRLSKSSHEPDSLKGTVMSQIKEKIDRIEELSEEEVALLMQMIQALRRNRVE